MLITCPECGKEVSDTIESCIHCGYRLKPAETNPEPTPETPHSEIGVIARRCRAGRGTRFFAVLGYILAGIFTVAALTWVTHVLDDFLHDGFSASIAVRLIFIQLIFGLAALLVVFGTIFWHRDKLNVYNNKPLAYVTEDDDLIHLVGLNGQEETVEPKNLICLIRGVSSDYIVVAKFVGPNGEPRKLLLGWTPNYREIQQNLKKLHE